MKKCWKLIMYSAEHSSWQGEREHYWDLKSLVLTTNEHWLENPLPLRHDEVGIWKVSFRYLQNLPALKKKERKKKMVTVIYRLLSWNHSVLQPLYVIQTSLHLRLQPSTWGSSTPLRAQKGKPKKDMELVRVTVEHRWPVIDVICVSGRHVL